MAPYGFSRSARPFRINVVITLAVRERTDATSSFPLPIFLSGCYKLGRLVGLTSGQQSPGDPRHLAGQRDRDDLERSPSETLSESGILLRLMAHPPQNRMGSDNALTKLLVEISSKVLASSVSMLTHPQKCI
jgi:hypothetical protein